jgi:thioredoxin-like negative regulator of GroEL
VDLTRLLSVLPVVGPIAAAAPEFIALFNLAKDMLDPEDQETAQQALADIQADNDEGHRRLQAKLAAAARR